MSTGQDKHEYLSLIAYCIQLKCLLYRPIPTWVSVRQFFCELHILTMSTHKYPQIFIKFSLKCFSIKQTQFCKQKLIFSKIFLAIYLRKLFIYLIKYLLTCVNFGQKKIYVN